MDFEMAAWEMTHLPSFAWSLAYTPTISSVIKLALIFIFVHFLAGSLVISTLAYFLVGRILGPGVAGLPGRRQQQGLFGPPGGSRADALEFGYCFDVSIRAFFPPYVLLYILQFLLMPGIDHENRVSAFFANLLYLAAGIYWTLITFLGYNALHFLHHTQFLLSPMVAWSIVWLVCTILGVNLEKWGVKLMFLGVRP
jgi:UNC-50 family